MGETCAVLVVDDEPGFVDLLGRGLEKLGYRAVTSVDSRKVADLIRAEAIDVVLTDLYMPGYGGLDLVRRIREEFPKVPVILMTGSSSDETAIDAMKLGAFDYLTKPLSMPQLQTALTKAAASRLAMVTKVGMGELESPTGGGRIIGKSPAMVEAFKQVGRVAALPLTVLVRGDTGTGKELFARAVYHYSDRSHQVFLAVNCAAIPETLLESELFGYERGAFTGAHDRRIGKFEQANQGTLFLDEVAELTLGTQAKLLRVLEDRAIQRLGGRQTIPIDVRIITATNRNLEQMVKTGRFREDLFHRLDVVTIRIPPLRDRREDIPELVNYLLAHAAKQLKLTPPKITKDAINLIAAYSWPGNVRQLENTLRRALIVQPGFVITRDVIEEALKYHEEKGVSDAVRPSDSFSLSVFVAGALDKARQGDKRGALEIVTAQLERELYRQAIRSANGNHSRASEWIGVSRVTFNRKLSEYGLTTAESWEAPPAAGAAGTQPD
jgi:DNA-binding NtrC family response regulator